MSDVGRYRLIFPRIWRHGGFRALPPASRQLALYLLSGPQTNRIGLFHFSPATAAEDLNVSTETVRKGLVDVSATFGWLFDAKAGVFFIPSWWRWNRPANLNVLTGNLKDLNEVPSCGLCESFASNLETLPETLHQTFIEGIRLRLPKHLPTQDQYPDLNLDREQEHRASRRVTPLIPKDEKQDGIESGLLDAARQVLRLTNPNEPMEHLLDTFRHVCKVSYTKGSATGALNTALSERRQQARA